MLAYLITNRINGKRYVGITTRTEAVRWRQHQRRVAAGSRHALHQAIAKHGADAFSVEVIARADSLEALRTIEVEAIARLGTFGRGGYNMTAGGEGAAGYRHTAEEVEARRRRRLGAKHSEGARAKMSAAHTESRHTPESRAKISAANKGRQMPPSHSERLRSRVVSDAEREARRQRAIGNQWSVGVARTDDQKERLRQIKTGKKLSETAKAKIRAARAAQPPTCGMAGKAHSAEAKAKTSAALRGIRRSPETIERMRQAAARRMAEGKNGAINRQADRG